MTSARSVKQTNRRAISLGAAGAVAVGLLLLAAGWGGLWGVSPETRVGVTSASVSIGPSVAQATLAQVSVDAERERPAARASAPTAVPHSAAQHHEHDSTAGASTQPAPFIGPLSGRVTDLDGTPLEGVLVRARDHSRGPDATWGEESVGVTDVRGSFQIEECSTRSWLEVDLDGYCTVVSTYIALNADGTFREADIRLAPTGVLRVRVVRPGGIGVERAQARIHVALEESMWGRPGYNVLASRGDVVTWEGEFVDIEVPAEVPLVAQVWDLAFCRMREGKGLAGEGPESLAGEPILVKPGQMQSLTVELTTDFTITGSVVRGPHAGSTGRAVAGAEIKVRIAGAFTKELVPVATLKTDAQGRFEFRHVSCEPWFEVELIATSLDPLQKPKPGAPGSRLLGVKRLRVGGHTREVITIAMEPRALAMISGELVDQDGEGIAARVSLVPAEPLDQATDAAFHERAAVASCMVRGPAAPMFSFSDLEPGEYWLLAATELRTAPAPRRVRTGEEGVTLVAGPLREAQISVHVHEDSPAAGLLKVECIQVSTDPQAAMQPGRIPPLLSELTASDYRAALAVGPDGSLPGRTRTFHGRLRDSGGRMDAGQGGGMGSGLAVAFGLEPGLYVIAVSGWPLARAVPEGQFFKYGRTSTGLVRVEAGEHALHVPLSVSLPVSGVIDWKSLPEETRGSLRVGFSQGDGLVRLPRLPGVLESLIQPTSRGLFNAMMIPRGNYEVWIGTADELRAGRPRAAAPVTVDWGMTEIQIVL